MATNPYEVEHNIKPPTTAPSRRRVDMSTFTSHLHQLQPDSSSPSHMQHIGPTPTDMAALFRLVQDQFSTLATDAPSESNREFLHQLFELLEEDIESPPEHVHGVDEAFLADLDRVPKKKLQANPDNECPICAEKFIDDPYPLVVELPCPGRHTFDLECISPWLLAKGTCPYCRHDFKKDKVPSSVDDDDDEEEDEDVDGLYG